MKKTTRRIVTALLAVMTLSANAQQVNTLYFLENAPMRHTINPAFQPVSNGYISITPLGWMNFGFGGNSLTLSDVLFVDPTTGKTITPLHPNADRQAFLKSIGNMMLVDGDITLGLVNMGFRLHDNGYLTIGINQRIDAGVTVPKSLFQFLVGGGMDLGLTTNTIALTGLGVGTSVYTEVGVGYSHRIDEQWTVGGKLKVLLGQAHVGFNTKRLAIDATAEQWHMYGNMALNIAGPINYAALPQIDNRSIGDIIKQFSGGAEAGSGTGGTTFDPNQLIDLNNIPKLITPSGYGAALDLGFSYKPIENLQISAAISDLGFLYWLNGNQYTCTLDTAFTGAGAIDYGSPAYRDQNGNFSTAILMDSVRSNLMGLTNAIILHKTGTGFAKMVSAKLNVGVDVNFWENRVGIGLLSATRLYNARLYEEITLGLSFRPVNWFNIAATYSLMNNGKYSNIGAGLSIMPYDGINLTLAMDYIPTSYAGMDLNGTGVKQYVIPDKTKMFNFAMGFSICWGTNRRDSDKDGVWDKLDMCPETPKGVAVDERGCPVDEDGDGVPDYADICKETPAAARGMVDINGCPIDSDADGVPDYMDLCPGTPAGAYGFVDANGCLIDSDADGVADMFDLCPGTPAGAYGYVDANGCLLDSDGDGVPDYMDKCPNTPAEVAGQVDANGCTADSDGDGVPDYMDQCPNTPAEVNGMVNMYGCPEDTDGDGVPDYLDKCPNTPMGVAVDAAGCPIIIDSDGDGVPDNEDECPAVAGSQENKGCPELKREVRTLLQKAMQGIEFESGQATIKAKSYPLLDEIATTFIENSNYLIEVQGHTDNSGKAEANKKLSTQRAEAVKNYLVEKGVPAERMTAIGYGDEQPIADNKTSLGRQKNRRVEFKINFEEVHYETVLDHAEPATEPAPTENTDEKL